MSLAYLFFAVDQQSLSSSPPAVAREDTDMAGSAAKLPASGGEVEEESDSEDLGDSWLAVREPEWEETPGAAQGPPVPLVKLETAGPFESSGGWHVAVGRDIGALVRATSLQVSWAKDEHEFMSLMIGWGGHEVPQVSRPQLQLELGRYVFSDFTIDGNAITIKLQGDVFIMDEADLGHALHQSLMLADSVRLILAETGSATVSTLIDLLMWDWEQD